MKTRILAPRQVLAKVDHVLARSLSPHDVAQRKPLEEVVSTLRDGRGYLRAAVNLAGGAGAVRIAPDTESTGAKSRLAAPIKIASRNLGSVQVESELALGPKDRVLLKQVATRLARFLTSRGKVLMRHEREKQRGQVAGNPETRGYQPASAKAAKLRMAAGEGRR